MKWAPIILSLFILGCASPEGATRSESLFDHSVGVSGVEAIEDSARRLVGALCKNATVELHARGYAARVIVTVPGAEPGPEIGVPLINLLTFYFRDVIVVLNGTMLQANPEMYPDDGSI